MSPFSTEDALGAYSKAAASWKSTTESIRVGLCCTYQSRMNPRYFSRLHHSAKPAWIFVGIVYSLFDHSCRITSGHQLVTMDLQNSLEGNFSHLKKWGYFADTTTFDDFLAERYGEGATEADIAEFFGEKFSHIKECYVQNIHPLKHGEQFPKFLHGHSHGKKKISSFRTVTTWVEVFSCRF